MGPGLASVLVLVSCVDLGTPGDERAPRGLLSVPIATHHAGVPSHTMVAIIRIRITAR
jgi:hypothetical protein